VILNNLQITKARSENFKPGKIYFSGLSMLVGISEAIRLLSTSSSLMMKDLIFRIFKYFITLIKTLALFISARSPSLKEHIIKGEITDKEITPIDNEASTNNPVSVHKKSSNNSGKGKDDKFNE
jgi:hypothetical protein